MDGVDVPANDTSKDSMLKLAGTLTAALTATQELSIYNGSQFLGKASVNGTDWTFDLPEPLSNAEHSLRAQVYNVATSTDVSTSDAYGVKVDARYSYVAKASGGYYPKSECVEDRKPVDESGNPLTDSNNKPIRLIWEGKLPGDENVFRSGNQKFTNYGTDVAGDTGRYVKTVNELTQKVCGISDWEVPTDVQLKSLRREQTQSATTTNINTTWFENYSLTNQAYWTSTGNGSLAWFVSFLDGYVGYSDRNSSYGAVRLVRRVGQ